MIDDMRDYLKNFVHHALQEDVGSGDHTSLATIPADNESTFRLLVKDVGILAGMEVAKFIFHEVDPDIVFSPILADGRAIHPGDVAFTVRGNTRSLLVAERLVLNTMQRMCGIATLTNRFCFEVEDLPVQILDTRKTTPNLRPLEKLAVRLGGGTNYRAGLYDWIMIKDNHIDASGGVKEAIEAVAIYFKDKGMRLPVTVEVRNLVELAHVLDVAGDTVTRIMLDNFELPLLAEAVKTVDGRYETEASGGVNIHTVRRIGKTGVDFISIGALTHSATNLDLSLKVVN